MANYWESATSSSYSEFLTCSKCMSTLELPLQEKMLQDSSSSIVWGRESRAEEKKLNLKSQKTFSHVVQSTQTIFCFFQSWLMRSWSNMPPSNLRHS